MTVFLVEDSDLLRRQIQRSIDETGVLKTVGWASTATEAIRCIRRNEPDIVVLDLTLEDSSGWDVVSAAQSSCQHVVILTNHALTMHRAEAAARGVTHFFDKTAQFAEFLDCITGFALADSDLSTQPEPA